MSTKDTENWYDGIRYLEHLVLNRDLKQKERRFGKM